MTSGKDNIIVANYVHALIVTQNLSMTFGKFIKEYPVNTNPYLKYLKDRRDKI